MTWFPNEQKRTLNRLIAIWIYLLLPMKYTTFSGKSMMKSQLTYQRVLGKSMNVFNIFHILHALFSEFDGQMHLCFKYLIKCYGERLILF